MSRRNYLSPQFLTKISDDGTLNIESLIILTCAIFIASIGLNVNSTARPRVLILSSAETQESVPLNDEFIRKLRESIGDEIHIEWCNYHALQIEFKTGDIKVWHIPSGLELREFDL